ncbi:hypothetical protein [Sphingobacterium zeae]|uniref:hypothetical protein n=1 Tax=Sphingobacterium zeae TaxID=1776859 RepID=UPI0036121DFF
MNNVLFKPELLQIASYKLLKLNIENLNEDQNEDKDVSFTLKNSIELSFNSPNKLIKSKLDISISRLSDIKSEVLARASITVEYLFLVENFEELHYIEDNGTFKVNQSLTESIKAIVYSTTRGLLMDRFKDTPFDGFILPIIDPRKDISDNASK